MSIRFEIVRDGYHCLQVVDTATGHTLYLGQTERFSSHLEVMRAPTGPNQPPQLIGEANFPRISRTIDVQVCGDRAVMEHKSVLSGSHVMRTPRFCWEWEKSKFGRDLTLVDQDGNLIARFDNSRNPAKIGMLDVFGAKGPYLDWVVVTALAKIVFQRKRARRGAAATTAVVV